jgi:cytochrome c oxidase cbb3-type subunit 3
MTTYDDIDINRDEPFDGIRENKENNPPSYFNLLFYGLIIWGILFMAYYLLSGWSSQGEFQEKMDAHQQKYSQGMQGGR